VTGTASSGGTTAFTSVFASRTIAIGNLPSTNLSHSLTLPNHGHSDSFSLPDHVHSISLTTSTDGSHNHDYEKPNDGTQQGEGTGAISKYREQTDTFSTSSDGSHDHTVSGNSGDPTTNPGISGSVGNPTTNPTITGSIALGGSGTAMDFAVQYVDCVIGTKD
jgi:hypothetical protein